MLSILLFFIIGQSLNIGISYWIIWGIYIVFWTIKLIFNLLKVVLEIKEEQ